MIDVQKKSFIPDYQKVISHLENVNFALTINNWKEDKIKIVIPERFSISERPNETIRFLRRIYTFGKCDYIREITFDHSKCEFLGLSASTIMDIIILSVYEARKSSKNRLELAGIVPKDPLAKDVLIASGLPYHLNIPMKYSRTKVERFATRSGVQGEERRKSGIIATELTEYFNRCLEHQNMELRDEGKLLMATLLGEVLDNCEIHGGEHATWYTQGHYENNPNNLYGEMQLLFLNLGDTIYQGLEEQSTEETEERLDHYLRKHVPYLSANWDKEMACTVFALQEGISRLRDKKKEGYEGRGTGTVSLIETLNLIGKCDDGQMPEMTIISGRTYIKFNGKYNMRKMKFDNDPVFGNGEKSIIAFNGGNNIYKPADTEFVQKLQENFPGTVISLRVYLDHRYISKRKGEYE